MRIMIGGGFNVDEPETKESKNIAKFAAALARAAIDQEHSIVCGNLTPFDKIAIEAAWERLGEGEKKKNRVRSFRPKGADVFTNIGMVLDSDLEDWAKVGPKLRYPEPIWEADVVILVGGWEGARTAATWAKLANRPVLPVASFGLAARELFPDVKAETMARPDVQVTTEEFDTLNSAISDLDDAQAESLASEIVDLAERLVLPRDVFVVMSYREDEKLEEAYKAFEEACGNHKFVAQRLDKMESGETFEITEAIKERLSSCAFTIVDLTDERPNVYYELGYAQAKGKPVILTKQKGTKIHFDVNGLKILEWSGFLDARDKVSAAVENISDRFGG